MTVVSNNQNSFGANTNPDYDVETVDGVGGKKRQVIATDSRTTSTVTETISSSISTTSATKFTTTSGQTAYLFNPYANTENVYVSFGNTATTNHPFIAPGGSMPVSVAGVKYIGAINCRTAANTATLMLIVTS